MNRIKRLLRSVDAFQQRRPALAFPIAVWKKFGDDQAGSLAALIAYYAFASIFPLLLVLATVLNLVLQHNASLRKKLIGDALHNYPFFSQYLPTKPLSGAGLALVIGLVFTFLGARGVASAMQNALNTVWEVPLTRRPGFPWAVLRSLGLMLVIGTGEIVTLTLSGLAGGAGHVLSGAGAYVATTVVSLILNVGVFWLAFRLATAAEVAGRNLWLGAVLSAIVWQILQSVAAYVIHNDVGKSRSLYGTFGIVLGLLAWLYLQAEVTLYAAEANVVQARGLWPRSLFPPPLTEQDRHAYEMYAKVQQRRPEQEIIVRIPDVAEPDGDSDGTAAGATDRAADGDGQAGRPRDRGHPARPG
ncbi:MAG TPA: YihY/virulence factor BrkB family protein [Streptosporangiaceae bacterium]|jgi:YihY family inner membrane protein